MEFLSTCAKEQLLPKGFQLKWTSHYAEKDVTTEVINRASRDLVKACHQLASRKLASLTQDFERGWSELSVQLVYGGAEPAIYPAK